MSQPDFYDIGRQLFKENPSNSIGVGLNKYIRSYYCNADKCHKRYYCYGAWKIPITYQDQAQLQKGYSHAKEEYLAPTKEKIEMAISKTCKDGGFSLGLNDDGDGILAFTRIDGIDYYFDIDI